MTKTDFDRLEIIDIVETSFESTRNTDKKILLETGYTKLLTIAQKKHDGEIDIMNIELQKNYSKRNLWYMVPTLVTGVSHITSFYTNVHAKGVVVRLKEK